jgi:hypothetical protein
MQLIFSDALLNCRFFRRSGVVDAERADKFESTELLSSGYMPNYTAPVRDMLFAYFELNGGEAIGQLPGYEELDRETLASILDEAGRFVSDRLLSLNRSGDKEGCRQVTTPGGFKAAYDEFIEAGSLSIPIMAVRGCPNPFIHW